MLLLVAVMKGQERDFAKHVELYFTTSPRKNEEALFTNFLPTSLNIRLVEFCIPFPYIQC